MSGVVRLVSELIERLAAEGRVRELRRDGRLIDVTGLGGVALAGVTDDSRLVGPGVLFAAIPGLLVDGHDFVAAAVATGA